MVAALRSDCGLNGTILIKFCLPCNIGCPTISSYLYRVFNISLLHRRFQTPKIIAVPMIRHLGSMQVTHQSTPRKFAGSGKDKEKKDWVCPSVRLSSICQKLFRFTVDASLRFFKILSNRRFICQQTLRIVSSFALLS